MNRADQFSSTTIWKTCESFDQDITTSVVMSGDDL